MRSEEEVRENLEWLKIQCKHFTDSEEARVVNQLEILLWILGSERAEARSEAETIWQIARKDRRQSPQDY